MSNLENPLCYSDCCRHSERSEESFNLKFTEEFGLIPNDWEVKTFEDTFSFLPTNSITRAELSEQGTVKNVHYGDILVSYPNIIRYSDIKTFINNERLTNLKLCKNGDLIIADTAEDETVGKAVEIQELQSDEKVVAGMHTMLCRPNNDNKFASKFLGYFINSSTYHNQLLPLITGIKVSSVSKMGIKTTKILLPPLPEQEKIAEVLSDVDSLIDKTLGLINKKKDLKTATMQKLLTPKDDWECKTLGECVQVQGGYSFNSEKFTKNGIPIIRISNIYNNGVIIDNETVYYEPFNINKEFIINKGDILIAMSGATTGKVGIYKYGKQSYLNQRVGKFVATNKYIVMQYIEQVLNSNQFINELNKSIAQGAQPNISSKQIEEIQFYFPTKSEQEKIATILSDMDLEIETLEKELGKYQDLKMGMMQQLLTGQVRLLS